MPMMQLSDLWSPIIAFIVMIWCFRRGFVGPIMPAGSGLIVLGSLAGLFAPPKEVVWFAVVVCIMVAGVVAMLIGLGATLLRNIRRRWR